MQQNWKIAKGVNTFARHCIWNGMDVTVCVCWYSGENNKMLINYLKIIQCDFLDFCFRFRLSQLKCTYDKNLQTSTCFVSRKICKIGSVSNTCSPHFTFAHICIQLHKITLEPFKLETSNQLSHVQAIFNSNSLKLESTTIILTCIN